MNRQCKAPAAQCAICGVDAGQADSPPKGQPPRYICPECRSHTKGRLPYGVTDTRGTREILAARRRIRELRAAGKWPSDQLLRTAAMLVWGLDCSLTKA